MQDRFKFRFYDKSISEMSYDVCIGLIKDRIKRDWVCADTTCGQITYTDKKLNDIVLMQCTGLKDKNGKLIYEGDVVLDLSSEKHTVTWFKTCWGLIRVKDYTRREVLSPQNLYEVIGNIYENPELLEAEE